MMTYTVHEPELPQADRLDRAEELRFVKDGFSWWTALFPPLGFAARKLWWAVLAYVGVVLALTATLNALHVSSDLIALFVLALNLYLGFEASTIESWFLDQQGWTTVGSVMGRNRADCERRFFENWLPDQPAINSTAKGGARSQRGSSGWPFGARA